MNVANTAGCAATCAGTPLPPTQPGANELEGVPSVGFGARRAGGDAAVAAGFVDDPVRQARGRQRRGDLAGGGIDPADLPAQADGMGASGGGPDVIQPGA